MIAGPRVLEHMVDTVLYFEGERGHQFRILRAVKNRFGPANEIGVFEMTDAGLMEVPNPSALFLAERHGEVSGATVFAGMEGSRPMLVEIQALLAPSLPGTPRRAVVGWDTGRLAMVLAVLETRCGLALGGYDVYLNVAGGLRIGEPAADLAVAAALISSRLDPSDARRHGCFRRDRPGRRGPARRPDRPAPEGSGEVGLYRCFDPARWASRRKNPASGLRLASIAHLSELVERLRAANRRGPRERPFRRISSISPSSA